MHAHLLQSSSRWQPHASSGKQGFEFSHANEYDISNHSQLLALQEALTAPSSRAWMEQRSLLKRQSLYLPT